MDIAYLDRLPADVRQLVAEIEGAIEREIEIKVDPERVRRVREQRNPLACEVDENGARLLLPTPDEFPESAVLHELLHIHRFSVERVPKLVVCDDAWDRDIERAFALDQGIHGLDNNIEHLVIVPRELRLRPQRRGWWEPIFQRLLDKLASGEFAEQMQRDNNAFVAWVSIRHVLGGGDLLIRARRVLESLDLIDRAERLFQEISRAVSLKEDMARIWLLAIDMPLENICFEYIDVHCRATREAPLRSN